MSPEEWLASQQAAPAASAAPLSPEQWLATQKPANDGLINQPPAAPAAPAESGAAFTPISRNIAAQGAKLRQKPDAQEKAPVIGGDRSWGEFAQDITVKAGQGVVGLGEAVIGLTSLATGALTGGSITSGEGWANLGYDPKRSKELLTEWFASDKQKALEKAVAAAGVGKNFIDGFADQIKVLEANPEFIPGALVESLPSMLAAGGGARAVAEKIFTRELAAGAAKGLTPAAAEAAAGAAVTASKTAIAWTAAAGEGALASGSIAEEARQAGRTWSQYVLPALVGGVATAVIGRAASKIPGMGDADTALFTRGLSTAASATGGRATRTLKSAFQEGVLEEMPQSTSEAMFGNLAQGKPAGEGLGAAAAQGLVVGLSMGGGMGGISKTPKTAKETRADELAKALQSDIDSTSFTQSGIEREALAAMDPNGPLAISPSDTRLPVNPQPPAGGAAATPGNQWAAGSDIPNTWFTSTPNVTAAGGLLAAIESATTVDEAINAATKAATQLTPNYAPFAETPGVTDTFRTARGSTYALFDDGTTQRNRAGEGADTGLQPRSGATVFMDDMLIDKIGKVIQNEEIATRLVPNIQNNMLMVESADGQLLTTASFSTTPEVGMSPVEIFGNESPVGDRGTNVHFGSTITEVNPLTETTPAAPPTLTPESLLEKGYTETVRDSGAKIFRNEGHTVAFNAAGELINDRTLIETHTITNSYLSEEPIEVKVIADNISGKLTAFTDGQTIDLSPRASKEYLDGVPIAKVLETEFSDSAGILPSGENAPHTTTVERTANAQTTETVTPETGSETPPIQVTPPVGGGLINTPTTGTLAGGVPVTGTATEAAAPRVEDGETYVAAAVTGTPFTATLLRGQGREDSPYNSLGAQVPILGQGIYTTPSRSYAQYFGPNVTEQTVTLQNPLVISNDDQWRALTKEAGWAFSNPFGQDTEKVTSDIATLRSQLEAKGYDGVVIQVPASELTGKTLGKVFGASQVIVFNPPTAGGVPTLKTPAGGVPTAGTPAGGAPAVETPVSINDITNLVVAKKVSGLTALTQQLTGKTQLEELNPAELTAVHDALTMDTHPLPLPSHMESVSQDLYGVPAAVEAAKTERDNRPITDQVNERGVGETPEMSMDALTAAKANIGKLNGQLAGGARTGATAGGLLEAWSGYHRVLNDILASRRENPKLWADYAERQAQVAQLNVGDTALSATPSTDNPFGQPVTILKKNPKTWSVQEAGGATLNVLPVTLRPVIAAPVAGTPTTEAPTAGTPTGGTPTGGTPTGGTPTGGTPAIEIKADTPITPRRSKLRWEAEKPGVEAIHTTLAEVPHIITPEGAFHYVRDAAAPKKLVLTAGFVSPEAQAAYEKETAAAAQKKITEELDKEPMKVAIDTADAAAVAELIYGKTVEDEFLPIIFPDEKLIRMAVDPAQLNTVEAALSKYGFRITDRSVPVKTDDPAATGPERISVSALYRPGRTDIQAGGAQFIHNRKGATTAPPVPKDPTDGQIDKMLKAVDKDTLFDINLGTFGAVMFKEGMVANIENATDYLRNSIAKVRYLSATTGNRQAIKLALGEGIDVAAMLDKYVAAANKLQGIFNDSENVANLVVALNTAYVADIFGATNTAKYTADGLALRGQMTDQKLAEYIDRMRDLFLVDENSSDQTKRIVKKDADVPPQLGNIIRRGMRDHRQGRDVSVDDFLTTFGFFPGGFSPGEWVTQLERAAHLNAVYDSLYDLADLSGIDPIMLGLGQKLKLAIGAQGRGGKTAAHYWSDTNEINLTKTKGDGTVAHEWNHGLDHNLRATTNGDLLMKDTVTALRSFLNADRVNDILRGILKDTANNAQNRNTPPKKAFFAAIASGRYGEAGEVYRRATGQTGFYQQAKKLDEGSNKPYYATPHELLSRAFESMLFDASNGGTPYLVGPTRAGGYMSPANGYKAAPYPTGEERARLNEQTKSMLAQIDPKTLEVKTYAASTNIIEIDGLGFAVVDQNSLGSGDGTLIWHKTRALAETEQKASSGEKRILTPYKLQVSKTNIAILEMATDIDAIIDEMGLFKWPEVKNGSMAESMFFHMRQGWWPKDNADLMEYAGKAFIQQPQLLGFDPATYAGRESIAAFKPSMLDNVKLKQTQEDFEAAASRYVGQIITDMRAAGSDDEAIYRHIVALYAAQPLLKTQTSTSVANQAYSTPLPIAYLSGLLARVSNTTTVLEPTAGNGLLAVTANPKNVIALELEHHRADNLKLMEFGRVEQGDALVLLDGIRDQETDVLLTNPPFGSLPTPVNVPSWTGATYKISKIDHLIAAKALRGIADNGRAVLIIGAHFKPGMLTTPDRVFLNWLYSNYNVADHFELAGNLYARQGATFPIRVLVIAGRNQTESAFSSDFVISRVNTFDELWSRYVQARDNSEKVLVGAGKSQPKVGGGNIPAGGLQTGNTLENGNVGGNAGAGGSIQNGQPGQPGGRGTTAGAAGQLGTPGQPNAGELTGARDDQVGVAGEGGTSQQGGRNVRGEGSIDAELGGLSDVDLDDIFADLEKPKRAPKSTGPKAPGTPSTPRGPRRPRKLELTGDAEIDAIFADLNAALNGTPPAASKNAESPQLGKTPEKSTLTKQVDEALTRLARQADTENKGGNDDPASGQYSRRGQVSYADVKPILQRLYDAYLPKYDSVKALVLGMYENLKKVFGETILPHLRAFVDDRRVKVIELPANQTPIQTEPIDTESQVVYYGKSRYNSEGIYLPRSQAEFTYTALENLEAQEGDIDEFVAKELGYASTDEMAIGLAGYQIDALGLAISANKMGKGFVVGDDTGVGKGRTAAAMLVWAKKNGKVPIFLSLNETLYSDMYRDLKDIGHGNLRIGMTNTESKIIEDIGNGESRTIFENKKGDGKRLTDYLTANGAVPPNIDIVFTTYSQLGGSGSAGRQAAIASLVGSGKAALVMDEAHNAAGDSKTNKYFMSLLTGEGLFGRDAAGDAKPAPADWAPPPALYLSATFAKRPDNMPLYIHTNLRYAADTPDELKELFGKGAGTDVLQQIASEMLVKSGSMIRRERSYDGVKMNFVTDDTNASRDAREVDNITSVLRTLVTADRALKEWMKDAAVQSQIVRLLGPAGSSMGATGNSFSEAQGTAFMSVVHNYVSQMLLATKVKTAVDMTVAKMNTPIDTIDGKKETEKVVLALQNTMEALLNDYVSANNVSVGGELANLGWQTVLRRGVDSTRRVTLKSATGQKTDDIKVTIPFDMMPPSIRAGYAKVDAMIQAFQSPLPVSPIDAIRQQLEAKFVWTVDGKVTVGDEAPAGVSARHLVVKEISGRTHGVDYRHDVPRYMELDDPDRVAVIAGFQNGDKAQKTGPIDVVILTAAGATGISLHASVKAFDQRPRHMIILQPHADISVFKQLLGRIHRTGQVFWPSFTMLATGIPAERRIMAVIKKKMSSLVSNTSAGSSATSMEGVDFINQYGDVSVARYLNDHSDIRVFMDYTEWEEVEDAAGREVALKASGRAGLLPVTDQQEFFDSVESDYNTEIERRNATGTNALQRNVYPFNATLEESAMLDEGLDPNNPFTAGVAMDRYSVDIVGEVPSQAKVENAIDQALAGRSASDVVDQIESDLKVSYDEANNQLILQQRDLQAAEAAPNATDKEKEILAAQLEAIQKRIDVFSERREKTLRALRDNYPIGSGYSIFEINDVPSSAVVVSYTVTKSQSKTGNPYAPSNFKINFQRNLPGARVPVSLATLEGNTINKEDFYRNPNLADWFALKSAIGGRKKTYIATGNILQATRLLQGAGGEIANFTLDTSKTVPGLIMPAKYNPGPLAQQRYTLRTPAATAQFALSAWSAMLQKKWADTGMQEYSDAYQAINKLSFTQSIPDSAIVYNESSNVTQGKNGSWVLSLDVYSPLKGYTLNVDAKNKKLVANKTLLGLLKGNDLTRRSRTAPTFSSSARIDDPQQVLDLLQFLHKQSPAAVSPDLAPFAKEVVKADFDIAEAKRGSAGLPSRAGAVTGGQTVEAVRSQLVTLEGINVQVVQSANQLPEASAPSDVEGVWYSGTTVYLVADNLPNATRVQQVLAHEAIGHAAMEAMLGPKLMADLINNVQNLEKTGHRLTREVAAQVDRTQPGLSADRRAKEIIAVMAERGEHVKGALWQRTLYAVRQWLRSKGFDIAFSESDVLAALRDAETFAKRGPNVAAAGLTAFPQYSTRLGRQRQENTPEFKRWFGDSKVVDAEGKPLVVYHGGTTDIAEFNTSAKKTENRFGNSIYAADKQAANEYATPLTPDRRRADRYFEAQGAKAESVTKEEWHNAIKTIRPNNAAWEQYIGLADNAGVVTPLYMRIENPATNDTVIDGLSIERSIRVGNVKDGEVLKQKLIAAGYDGVVYKTSYLGRPMTEYVAFSPTQIKSAIGNTGTFDPANPDIRYSRGGSPAPSGVAAAVANAFPQYSIRGVTNDVMGYTAQVLHTDETFNLWHRSVGTQQHKAFINADFAKVYDEGQKFLADVSTFANTAADEALSLLPRIERFRDFAKKSPSEADVKSAMNATMAGTLYGGGSPLQGRKWNAGELAAGRADDALPGTAQAFTPLTPDQIKLYFEGQAAVGVALDNFTKGVIHRLTSRHGVAFDIEMSLEDGAELVREQLQEKADQQTLRIDTLRQGFAGLNPQDPRDVAKRNRLLEQIATAESQRAVFEGLISEVTVVEDRATSLKEHGYFPAMRFGRYAVYITHEDPVTQTVSQVYFGLFENQTKANLAAMALAKEYPGDKITRGVISQEQYALFQGLSLDALENFADHITDTNGNAISKDPLVQGFLKAAVAERSALKRQIHRKGVAGYSDEMPRVLASYILSMSRSAASYFHSTEMDAYTRSIKDGSVKDEAIKLVTYLKNPGEEAQAIRGLLFTQFLGGSIAHGIINATSPILVTFPYLSQYTTATNASLKIAAAAKQNVNKLTGDVRDAYLRAKKEGVVAPQEIHQLRAESGGAPIFGNSLALRKFSFAWGAIYAVTEQMNRTTTFLAAYNIATENGRADAYEFAVKAVNETQFVYNKGNRPNWARGAIGATVFTFKQFSVSYLELAKRMYDLKDPNGKRNLKPFALLLLLLLVGGGAEGLPFAEDMEDLLDTIGQWLGYATNSKKWVHKFFAEAFGSEELGRVAARGISGFNWMPVDVSLRFGMGNLIPGTTLLKPSEKNKAKALLEFAGPVGQFVPFEGTMGGKALEKLRKVDFGADSTAVAKGVGSAALEIAPVAVQNLGKGVVMAYTGQYPDARNRQGVKVTGGEAALKMIGLQPSSVANQAAKLRDIYEDIAIQKQVEGDIVESWANAIVDKNPSGVNRAMARVREWNSENPQLKIAINNAQLRARVIEMRIPQNTRIIRNAPRELRGSVAQDLAR